MVYLTGKQYRLLIGSVANHIAGTFEWINQKARFGIRVTWAKSSLLIGPFEFICNVIGYGPNK